MEILRYDTGATMSRVTEVNGLLFFSGHVAAQGETMEEQANALFARFDELFARMAANPSLLGIAAIENTIAGSLLPNHELLQQSRARIIAQKEEFNAVWDKWITPGCAPARVCVQAGLGDTPYRMEISVIAAKVE